MRFFIFLSVVLQCFAGAAADLPALVEKALERRDDSLDRFLTKLQREHEGLLKLLQVQAAIATERGDQRTAQAIGKKAAELTVQLKLIEDAVEGEGGDVQNFVGPNAVPQPIAVGVPRIIAIKGDDKVGFSLGPMPRGAVIALQYVGGAWTNGNSTESPDETKNTWSQCCIAATSAATNLHNDILERVPLQTVRAPWQYRLQQNYDNVTVRMGDDIYNGPGHSDNGGIAWYRIAVGR